MLLQGDSSSAWMSEPASSNVMGTDRCWDWRGSSLDAAGQTVCPWMKVQIWSAPGPSSGPPPPHAVCPASASLPAWGWRCAAQWGGSPEHFGWWKGVSPSESSHRWKPYPRRTPEQKPGLTNKSVMCKPRQMSMNECSSSPLESTRPSQNFFKNAFRMSK